jgi:hypothetical protein
LLLEDGAYPQLRHIQKNKQKIPQFNIEQPCIREMRKYALTSSQAVKLTEEIEATLSSHASVKCENMH